MQAIYAEIRDALSRAPHKGFVAELHLQVLKHADAFETVSGREFCAALGLEMSLGTEFTKMKKIYRRLRNAGLDPALL